LDFFGATWLPQSSNGRIVTLDSKKKRRKDFVSFVHDLKLSEKRDSFRLPLLGGVTR
jgi:hypothetical protein